MSQTCMLNGALKSCHLWTENDRVHISYSYTHATIRYRRIWNTFLKDYSQLTALNLQPKVR